MQKQIIKIFIFSAAFFALPSFANAANYFNWDAESNVTSIGTISVYNGATTQDCSAAHLGSCSMKLDVIGNDSNNQSLGVDLPQISYGWNFVNSKAMYYRWWMKIEPGFSWGTGTAKTKASRVLSGSQGYTGYLMHDGFLIGECSSGGCALNELKYGSYSNSADAYLKIPFDFEAMNDGLWHEYVVKVKPNTSAICTPLVDCDAQFKAWVDGQSVGEYNNFKLHDNSGDAMTQSWGTWMAKPYFQLGGTVDDGGAIYLDDFSTDDSFNSIFNTSTPSVLETSGTLENGSTVDISGAGFGNMNGSMITWDDFESQLAGSPIMSASPKVGPTYHTYSNNILGNSTGISFSADRGHSGNESAKIDWTAAGSRNASFGWGGQGPYSSLYISYWRYMNYPNQILPTTTNHKQFYIFGTESGPTPQAISYVPAGGQAWGISNNNGAIPTAGGFQYVNGVNYGIAKDWIHTINTWNRWEYWIKLNTTLTCTMGTDCDGQRTEWIDAQQYFADLKYQWTNNAGRYQEFNLGTMHGQSGSPDVGQAYFDDLYIATTQARVEIGDAATWNTCNHREIQIPVSWTDSLIQIKINQGTFPLNIPVYLYVVDSNGNVNANGYQLSLIDSSNMTAPAAPNGLFVQ